MTYTSFVNALFSVRVARTACQQHLTRGEAIEAVAESNLYKIGLMLLHLEGCERCRLINIILGGETLPLRNFLQFLVFATAQEREELDTMLDGNSNLDKDERLDFLQSVAEFVPGVGDIQSENLQVRILMTALGEDLKTRYSENGMTLS